jgi:probable F420-dependent oxidoreductase
VRVYASIDPTLALREVGAHAQRVERLGYDGLAVAETVQDGFHMALLALEHTTRLTVMTSVVLAFPRSPMLTAYDAWSLQRMSEGRFGLGLGSQVKGNIVGRFSVPWAPPVARMREYLESLSAIFEAFATGGPLRYEGEHYRFTRLQPFFNPGPLPAGVPAPPPWLGGIGPGMVRLAGALAAGYETHPTNSGPDYLRVVARPALADGAATTGRTIDDVEIRVVPPIALDEAQREGRRRALAFLWSTPAYRPSLDLLERGDVHERLYRLSLEGRWDEMPGVVDDELLDRTSVTAPPDRIAAVLLERYRGLADAVVFPLPADPPGGLADGAADEQTAEIVAHLRAG